MLSGASSSFFKDTDPIMRAPPSWPHGNLITSQMPHSQVPSHWGVGLQHMHFWLQNSIPGTLSLSMILHHCLAHPTSLKHNTPTVSLSLPYLSQSPGTGFQMATRCFFSKYQQDLNSVSTTEATPCPGLASPSSLPPKPAIFLKSSKNHEHPQILVWALPGEQNVKK